MQFESHRILQRTILRGTVGSTSLGLALEGADDRDELGVCIEPLEYAMGFPQFEQYIYRTAVDRTGQHNARSEPGDLDLTIYSLRKYVRLALKGNPTIIGLLFLPNESVTFKGPDGYNLTYLASDFVSQHAGRAFLGYMQAQRQRLSGERGGKHGARLGQENNPYDTKYAMHLLRLGHQGVELMETGRLTYPLYGDFRNFLMNVRAGSVPLHEVLSVAGELEHDLKGLLDTNSQPREPNKEKIEQWMIDTYREQWT